MFELDPGRRDELAVEWAQRLVARGLGSIAVFLLEAHKPVAPLGAQAMTAFEPLLRVFSPWDCNELAAFLNGPDNVERLIREIEALEAERYEKRVAARRRAAEVRRRAARWRALRRRRA